MAEYGESVSNEMKGDMKEGSHAKLVDNVMTLNGVHYQLPSELSASIRRNNRLSYADKNIYTQQDNEVLTRIVSSNDFSMPGNAYIAFDMAVTGISMVVNTPATDYPASGENFEVTLGSGGGLSLFQRNITETKSGSQAEYIDQLCNLSVQKLYNENPANYIAEVASMAGIACRVDGYPISTNQTSAGTAGIVPVNAATSASVEYKNTNVSDVSLVTVTGTLVSTPPTFVAKTRRIVLPLWWLGGLWCTEKLIPAYLLSGLRLRLALNQLIQNIFTVYQIAGATYTGLGPASANPFVISSYQLTNIYIMCDNLEMSPMIFRKLTEQAGNVGLDYVYPTYYYQLGTVNANSSFNMEINKAVSRALAVIYLSQYQNQNNSQQSFYVDQNQSSIFDMIQYYTKLGDLNFPQQPLTINTPASDADALARSSEFYYQTLECFKKSMDSCHPGAVRFYNDWKGGFSALGQLLERSGVQYSGLPVNNSRALTSLLTFNSAQTLFLRSFLKYVKVLKVFLKESVPKE